jgi:hypothetical protein
MRRTARDRHVPAILCAAPAALKRDVATLATVPKTVPSGTLKQPPRHLPATLMRSENPSGTLRFPEGLQFAHALKRQVLYRLS